MKVLLEAFHFKNLGFRYISARFTIYAASFIVIYRGFAAPNVPEDASTFRRNETKSTLNFSNSGWFSRNEKEGL